MIILLNIETKNTCYKIFETIKYEFSKLDSPKTKKERPCKYSDEIAACTIYRIRNNIFSLKELEYKINENPIFKYIIGIDKVLDYSTLSLRLNKIKKFMYYGIYAMLKVLNLAFILDIAILYCFGNQYNNSISF